eukprot:SM000107S14039  [mRNA]  locus=s107:118121:119497:+ [translate_table: standard]
MPRAAVAPASASLEAASVAAVSEEPTGIRALVRSWVKEPLTTLDSVVRTLLSQNTTDTNSRRAFISLKHAFANWEEVLAAPLEEVADAIRCGGLAETKARRIQGILDTLQAERGELSMEYLHAMGDEEIKQELGRFKGLGPKTVACVLMFHLQREEFPVDTHVFRIAKQLGWVPPKADRIKTYLHLNERVPQECKYALHCLLVTHGKRCPSCSNHGKAQMRADGPCPLIGWNSRHPKIGLPSPESLQESSLIQAPT